MHLSSTANGPPADILQQALLPVVGHDICSQLEWWSVLATEKMVCAGGDGITAGCNVCLYSEGSFNKSVIYNSFTISKIIIYQGIERTLVT